MAKSIRLQKSTPSTYVNPNGTINYTISILNNGTVDIYNLQFLDLLDSSQSFVAGTVVVNGTPQPSLDPTTGFALNDILASRASTITFQAMVISSTTVNFVTNNGSLTYTYNDPVTSPPITTTDFTNTVTIPVAISNPLLTKSAPAYIQVTDSQTKSATVTLVVNNGSPPNNRTLLSPIVSDNLGFPLTFIPNSIKVNGVTTPGNIISGVQLGTIPLNSTTTVTFDVGVTEIPFTNPVPNAAGMNYTYLGTSTTIPVSNSISSNSVNMYITSANLSNSIKIQNKSVSDVNDPIQYTISVTNDGNTTALNLVILDTLPSGVSVVPNSVSLNGVTQPGADPRTGITVGDLAAGTGSILTFQVVAVSIPNPNPFINRGVLNYQYRVDPSSTPQGATIYTNSVNQQVNSAILSPLTKDTSLSYAQQGDTINYSLYFKNTGNVTANNVVFTDLAPFSTLFIQNSFKVNGVTLVGVNPGDSFSLGTVPANSAYTLTFSVYVNQSPQSNPITNQGNLNYTYDISPGNTVSKAIYSNIVPTTIVYASIYGSNFPKSVSTNYADIDDQISYTISLKNTGNTTAINLFFVDTAPNGTEFIPNSVYLNGIVQVGADPTTGITLPDLDPDQTEFVTFKFLVVSLPTPNPLFNTGSISYQFTGNPSEPPVSKIERTNAVYTQVNAAIIDPIKYTSTYYGDIGDSITYTIYVPNTGNVTATNVFFSDNISAFLDFSDGSVEINSISYPTYNPISGFYVPDIPSSSGATVTFSGVINGIPDGNYINNEGNIRFQHIVSNTRPPVTNTAVTNQVETRVNNANISGVGFKKSAPKLALANETIPYNIYIRNSGNTSAINIIFQDTPPNYTSFIPGSVLINGSPCLLCNPQTGFGLDTIPAGGVVNLQFKVGIDSSVPYGTVIKNISNINYSYSVDPSLPLANSSSTSNADTTIAVIADGTLLIKEVDLEQAQQGDILNYTINLYNTTNTLNSVIFRDTIPSYTSFITDSLYVNGTQYSGVSPQDGITLTTLPINAGSVFTFSVNIVSLPNPNPISNSGLASYIYTDSIGNNIANTIQSNIVDTYVNKPQLDSTKYVSTSYSDIGDTITYTIVASNNGNLEFTNLSFNDFITSGATTFNPNSLYINGVNQPGIDPFDGLNFATLPVGSTITINFTQDVDAVPIGNVVENYSNFRYKYSLLPSGPVVTTIQNSNIVSTMINHGALLVNKYSSKQYSYVGDELTFTTILTSQGNVSLQNIFFYDTVLDETPFIPGTVIINGVSYPSYDPNVGFPIGDLSADGTDTVAFQVNVLSLPSPNPFINTSYATFNYIVNPTIPITQAVIQPSTPAIVNIVLGELDIEKSVDKSLVTLGEIVVYTITVNNVGNVQTDVNILNDILPVGITYIPGTVMIDGVTNPNYSPATGIYLSTIPVAGEKVVKIQGKVTSIPIANPAVNTSNANFRYTISPQFPDEGNGYANSNAAETSIKAAVINASKSVNKSVADLNDILTYNIIFSNTGNISASNTVIKDIIQSEISVVPGSLTLNGNPLSGDLNTGIDLGTIPANSNNVISFKAVVNSIPSPNQVLNNANFNYDYIYDLTKPEVYGTTPTNTVSTIINNANFSNLTKYVNKQIADVGQILTYTLAFTNQGNIVAQNVLFTDSIPSDTSFQPGSVNVNGAACPTCNVQNGISLGDIAAGKSTTISFKVQILRLPNPNPIQNEGIVNYRYRISIVNPLSTGVNTSNYVYTKVNTGTLAMSKIASKTAVDIGDTLTYTLVLNNTGNATVFNARFTDIVQSGTSFIPNTLYINGMLEPGYDPNLGITIPDFPPSSVATVTFDIITTTIPNPNPFLNTGRTSYDYISDPSLPSINGSSSSNTTSVQLNHGDLITSKYVDKAYSALNDTLTYIVTIKNTGSVRLDNMMLVDTLPANTSFVSNSIYVNGVVQSGLNINDGVNLNPLFPNNVYTITFNVIVTTIPSPNVIYNNGTVYSTYNVDPLTPSKAVDRVTNQVQTIVNSADVSSINKTLNKIVATIGDDITYTLSFLVTGNTTAKNLLFYDTMPNGTIFQDGYAYVNNTSFPISNPQSGIVFGNIVPITAITVSFRVVVTTIPTPNPTPNTGYINYKVTVNPSDPDRNINVGSNTVYTLVNHADLFNVIKGVNKGIADINEAITYTLTIPNVGNISALNVVLTDPLSNGSNFIQGSLYVDGVNYPSSNISNGVYLGTIPGGVTRVVQFSVQAFSIPNPNPIPNDFNVNYYFIPYTGVLVNDDALSNTVYTQINSAILFTNKSVNETIGKRCDTLNYVITTTNTGNVGANNVVLIDTIPYGSTFVNNSLYLNNFNWSITPEYVPINSITPGTTATVSFKVKVNKCCSTGNVISNIGAINWNYIVADSLPQVNKTISTNYVYTLIQDNIYSFNKAVCYNQADVGETLTYFFSIENTFKNRMENIILTDSLPYYLSYMQDSIRVNGNTVSNGITPLSVPLGYLEKNKSVNVCFNAVVVTMPTINPIINKASINFDMITDEVAAYIPLTAYSNDVFTYVGSLNKENNKLEYFNSFCECPLNLKVQEAYIDGITSNDDLLREISCNIKFSKLWSECKVETLIPECLDIETLLNISLNVEIINYREAFNYNNEKLIDCSGKYSYLNSLLVSARLILNIEYLNCKELLCIKSIETPFSVLIALDNTINGINLNEIKWAIEDSILIINDECKLVLNSEILIYIDRRRNDLIINENDDLKLFYTGISSEEVIYSLSQRKTNNWVEGLYSEDILLKYCIKEVMNVTLTFVKKESEVIDYYCKEYDCNCNEEKYCRQAVLVTFEANIKVRYIDICENIRVEKFIGKPVLNIIPLGCNCNFRESYNAYVTNMLADIWGCRNIDLSAVYLIID